MLLYLTKKRFYKMKSFQKRKVLYFFKVIFTKMRFTKILLEISQELLQTTLSFILNFFQLELYHKNQFHGSHHTPSNICHKSLITLTLRICIWNLSLVWFLRIHQFSKLEFTFKFVDIELLRKGIQEQLYFENIVSTKSTFLVNWVIWKT